MLKFFMTRGNFIVSYCSTWPSCHKYSPTVVVIDEVALNLCWCMLYYGVELTSKAMCLSTNSKLTWGNSSISGCLYAVVFTALPIKLLSVLMLSVFLFSD